MTTTFLNKSKSPEGKRQRQAAFLSELRRGLSEEEACTKIGIGQLTPHKWKYRAAGGTDREFIDAAAEAKRVGAYRKAGEVPDFLTFREDYFAYEDKIRTARDGWCPATGRPWMAKARTSPYVTQAVAAMEANRRLVMILPPGHLKSSIMCTERTVYDTVKNRSFRTLIVQKNQTEAAKQVAQVQERLSSHQYYHDRMEWLELQGEEPTRCLLCDWEDGVPFKPETRKQDANTKWGQLGMIVNGRTSGEKDFTMQALGVGSQILGTRADRIVVDDVQDPIIGAKNPLDSREKAEWVRSVLLGRLDPTGQLTILANFFSPDDFAHKTMEYFPDYPVINFPALTPEGQPMAPEFWTIEGLKEKKGEVGPAVWDMTWMQNDSGWEAATFHRDALNAAKDESLIIGHVPYAVTDVFVGVDPATSDSGYCAMVVWGLDRHTRQRYLVDVFNKTGMRNWDNVTDQLAEFCRAYSARKAVVETNNTQQALINNPYFIRQITSTGARYTTYQTVTGTGGRAKQSNFDITTIGALFDEGLITIPYGGTTEDRERVDHYLEQLARWRTDDDGNSIKHLVRDLVMATLFAESEAFVLANRPKERIEQNNRAPAWAQRAWPGTYKRSESAFQRQSRRMEALLTASDSALDDEG